jgi:hypothetical protein
MQKFPAANKKLDFKTAIDNVPHESKHHVKEDESHKGFTRANIFGDRIFWWQISQKALNIRQGIKASDYGSIRKFVAC